MNLRPNRKRTRAGITSDDVFVVGASFQARVATEILIAAKFHVRGYFDDNPDLRGGSVGGRPVLGQIGDLTSMPGERAAFVAIGNNSVRCAVAARLRAAGVRLVNAIHPSAIVMDGVTCGDGILVCPGAVVMVGSAIENDAVVNTRASIDHDSRVRKGAYLAPGVCTAGAVDIGEKVFIGIHAALGPGIRIGRGSVIGAGAAVLDDVPEHVFAAGVPAQIKRKIDRTMDWRRLLGGARTGETIGG